MPKCKKIFYLLLILVLATTLLIACIPRACSTESAAGQQTSSFIANVLGYNMNVYTETVIKYLTQAPPSNGLNGLPFEAVIVNLTSASTVPIQVMCQFYNGTLALCQITTHGTDNVSPIYAQATPQTILGKAIEILQRYATYANAAYVQPMINILDANPALNGSSNNAYAIAGNIKCTVSVWEDQVTFNWHYVVNGVDYDQESLDLGFTNGVLTMLGDNWGLFKIPNSLSINVKESEAEEIAWTAANNPNVLTQAISGVGNVTMALSDSPQVELIGTVDNYMLRPMWAIQFYANNLTLNNALVNVPINGVEVGVWADNGQIAYCTVTGYQGVVNPQTTTPQATASASALSQPATSSQPQPNTLFGIGLILGITLIVALAVAAFVIKKIRR